jgi:hypothetical protein
MKKYFTILCIAGLVAGMSCKFDLEDDPALTPTYSSFSFATATATVTEGEQVAITINRGNDAYEGVLTLQVVTTGSKITNPAVENTDFTLSKTIQFDGRYASENVVITTAAANGKTTGDKQFGLRLAQAEGSVQLSADTTWITIKDADEAVISFEITENLTIAEGTGQVVVTIVRSGTDWEGTVTLEALTDGLANAAILGTDYTLSRTSVDFALGETKKDIAIMPRADDNDFTGNTPFVLSIKSAPGATINEEESQINVTITEADGFAGLKTFLAKSGWEFDFRNLSSGRSSYLNATFASTSVDSVYNLTFGGGFPPPIKVSFSKQDYSMTVGFPQYAGMDSDGSTYLYFLRWSEGIVRGDNAYPSEAPYKFVLPFEWVTINLWDPSSTLRGYQLPASFFLGLWVYSDPDYIEDNCLGPYLMSDNISIAYWD